VDEFFPYLLLIIVPLIIAGIIYGTVLENRRRAALQAIAAKLNLRFYNRDASIAGTYSFLDHMAEGDNRYAFNVMQGEYRGHQVLLYDYHFETQSTDSKGHTETTHHYYCYTMIEQSLVFPELRIYPEGLLSKIGQMLGYSDIDFESSEFSRAFTVRGKDKKFAYDICHTRMMEYLLAHRNTHLEIENRCVALCNQNKMKPDQVIANLDHLVKIRELFPEYLYRQ
jgi:hypothetical protein